VAVTDAGLFVGRSSECHFRPTCPTVSRVHCELIVREGHLAVCDLDSRNGTFVNGERVTVERQLSSGDRLGMGKCVFEVVFDSQTQLASDAGRRTTTDCSNEAFGLDPVIP
jgi:pSer/pThr/pTyr-binding forkhead associated (FHA) protein